MHAPAASVRRAPDPLRRAARRAERVVGAGDRASCAERAEGPENSRIQGPDRDVLRLQEELSDFLGAQVEIRANRNGPARS